MKNEVFIKESNELAKQSQQDYQEWAKNGKWQCPNGHIFDDNGSIFIKKCRCAVCSEKTTKFIPESGLSFESQAFDDLYRRHFDSTMRFFRNKINSHLDFETFCGMAQERFIISVVSFDEAKGVPFYNHWFRNAFQEMSAFEKLSSKAASNPPITCALCGHRVAAITRFHLAKTIAPKPGFSGHDALSQFACENGVQRMRSVQIYRMMFPDAPIYGYNEEIKSYKNYTASTDTKSAGELMKVNGNVVYVPKEFGSINDADAVRVISKKIANILHANTLGQEERKEICKNSNTIEELEAFFEKALPYIAHHYNIREIARLTQYPVNECRYWKKQLKEINRNQLYERS